MKWIWKYAKNLAIKNCKKNNSLLFGKKKILENKPRKQKNYRLGPLQIHLKSWTLIAHYQ